MHIFPEQFEGTLGVSGSRVWVGNSLQCMAADCCTFLGNASRTFDGLMDGTVVKEMQSIVGCQSWINTRCLGIY